MEEKKKSGLATAGMVLGIVGICTSFIPFINNLSFIMAIIAFIFGIISLVKKGWEWKSCRCNNFCSFHSNYYFVNAK